MRSDVVVIGAGVIGISVALELQRRGQSVLVLDRDGVAAQASAGNAGAFAFTNIIPLATPGILRKAPGWLLDPMGPLSIPPKYAARIAPWMFRFWRECRRDRFDASVQAQAALMELSRHALSRQVAAVDGEPMIQRDGQLELFEGDVEFRAGQHEWQLRRQFGMDFEFLQSPSAIAEIQPGLSRQFTHAVFTRDWANMVDPKAWVQHLADAFRKRGGKIQRENVRAIAAQGEGVSLSVSHGELFISKVVLAAGAWSHFLARNLGERIPLETERGYNTTLPTGAFDLRTHLTFGGHGFVVTKINGGVRVGGGAELGGLDLPPNYKRAKALLQKAKRFIPGLDDQGGEQWMGYRPSLPDSLPVIGSSPKCPNVIYAFGHGHLGLTQAAGTAELVGSLANGEQPAVPIEPYAPTRF